MADVKASVQGNANQGVATFTIPADWSPSEDRTVIPLFGGWADSEPPVVLISPANGEAALAQPYVAGLVDAEELDEEGNVTAAYKGVRVGWVGGPEAADVLALSFLTRRQQQ